MYILQSITIYPVKSLGGISLQESLVQVRGLQYDRRWMLVDEDGVFVSQREIPQMVTLGTAIEGDALVVFLRNDRKEYLKIDLEISAEETTGATLNVWGNVFEGLLLPKTYGEWFSDQLGRRLRLAFMPENAQRAADPRYAPAGQFVSFADGFPFLLIGSASLDDLNTRMETPLPTNRFRPNFVVQTSEAFEEDAWRDIRIGDAAFRCVKPCARCVLPTIDQDNAERGAEPIRTLAAYRMQDKKILFGQNLIWTDGGGPAVVKVGDLVLV
jgi:uncharacterized protein